MRYRVKSRRSPRPELRLSVTFTGSARTVAWLSQVLASVTVVTSMRRQRRPDGSTRIDVICYRGRQGDGGGDAG